MTLEKQGGMNQDHGLVYRSFIYLFQELGKHSYKEKDNLFKSRSWIIHIFFSRVR